MIHKIKLERKFCDDVFTGRKTFEVRINDRNYTVFDVINFVPVENGKPIAHDVENEYYLIRYILTGYGLQDGYVCMAIEKINMPYY